MNVAYVAFDADRFRTEQPDDEIDQLSLGEDLAQWLHDALVNEYQASSTCKPCEEDWGGWIFGVQIDRTNFWIRTWIVGLEPRPGLMRLFRRKQISQATAKLKLRIQSKLASPEFRDVAWYDAWPDERMWRGEPRRPKRRSHRG